MKNIDLIKMSSKGQIVIPSEMRNNLEQGEEFLIIKIDERFILKKAKELTEQMREDLEFAKSTEEAWKDIEKGNYTKHSTKEYLKKLKDDY